MCFFMTLASPHAKGDFREHDIPVAQFVSFAS